MKGKSQVEGKAQGKERGQVQFPLNKGNIRMVVLGVSILLVGNVLLVQDHFVDVKEFSIPLYVAPVVLLLGFFLIGLGIFKELGK